MPGFGMRHRDGRLRLPETSSTFAQGHLRDLRPRRDPQAEEKAEQVKACEVLVARFGTQHVIGKRALEKLTTLVGETQTQAPTPAPSGKLGAINTTLPGWMLKGKSLGLLG